MKRVARICPCAALEASLSIIRYITTTSESSGFISEQLHAAVAHTSVCDLNHEMEEFLWRLQFFKILLGTSVHLTPQFTV